MQSIIDALYNVGIFLTFLAARFAVLLIVLAVLTVVFLAGLAVVRMAQAARRRSLGLVRLDGLLWRDTLYYSPGHAWMQWKGEKTLRVGLDDLAQHVLGRITEVVLPEPGQLLKVGEPAMVVRSGKRRAIVPAPVSGKVVSINRRIQGNPSLVHNSPYAGGWLFNVEPADDAHARLPYGQQAREWFGGEALRLSHFLERELGMAAADGGELVAPAPTLLTEEQWESMTHSFLQAPAK